MEKRLQDKIGNCLQWGEWASAKDTFATDEQMEAVYEEIKNLAKADEVKKDINALYKGLEEISTYAHEKCCLTEDLLKVES